MPGNGRCKLNRAGNKLFFALLPPSHSTGHSVWNRRPKAGEEGAPGLGHAEAEGFKPGVLNPFAGFVPVVHVVLIASSKVSQYGQDIVWAPSLSATLSSGREGQGGREGSHSTHLPNRPHPPSLAVICGEWRNLWPSLELLKTPVGSGDHSAPICTSHLGATEGRCRQWEPRMHLTC